MIIGHFHNFHVSRTEPDTVWLQHDDGTEVPLPSTEAGNAQPGDEIEAFVLTDANANPVATTGRPSAQLGECACMKVSSVTNAGAFLDWGIGKDLLLPYHEQRRPVQEGSAESVLVYIDNSGRLAATSRLDHHLGNEDDGFKATQPVSLLVFQRTDLGFKAVADNRAVGLLYKDEIFQPLKVGNTVAGYVKTLRPDGKLDLSLRPPGNKLKKELNQRVLEYLNKHDGVSLLTDKSPPEAIYAEFGVSKKDFKRALSALYKQRVITITSDRVELVSTPD